MSVPIPSHVSASAVSLSATATAIRSACTGFSTTTALTKAEADARRLRNEARRLVRKLASLRAQSAAADACALSQKVAA
ncbi:hypothetical protein [Caulobacter segnis]|uniref:Uncharacterized protein n=1 Tax=Caulobacter segnis TaxID=88688 RepID=A0A2W5V8W6_9CAUL|nr:hypothetical protein [Caulobacter segnis]PZR36459.1 MAG: hypothetical protein DI526_03205 [Caulobacter segnis]